MNIASVSRQALSRARRARVIHCPGIPYFGDHLAVMLFDAADRPAFLTAPDGAVVLFASARQADDDLSALAPYLDVSVDDFASRPPAQVLP